MKVIRCKTCIWRYLLGLALGFVLGALCVLAWLDNVEAFQDPFTQKVFREVAE
jgi:hypothetical protein